MDIAAIKRLGEAEATAHIPPLSDYQSVTPGWREAEYRHFEAASPNVVVGYWTGEPGEITLDPWPYTEICTVLTGRVAIRDRNGSQVDFGAGAAFLVPKGFVGRWITIEPATKIFIAIS